MDLKFKIQYKKGASNTAADALSRHPDHLSVAVVSVSVPSWLHKLQEGYEDDPQAQQLLTELSVHPENDKGFNLKDGILDSKEECGLVITCWLKITSFRLCITVRLGAIQGFMLHITMSNHCLPGLNRSSLSQHLCSPVKHVNRQKWNM